MTTRGTATQLATDSPPLNPLRGVLLVMAAVLAFALGDVLTKHLTSHHDVSLILALRYLVNLGLLLVFFGPRHRWGLMRTTRTRLVLVRAACLAMGSLTVGFAFKLMPVAETLAIIYLAPFAVMVLSVPLLKERVTLAGWIGAAVAFSGVLIIVRPGSGLAPFGVAFALVNAAMMVVYHLLSRLLAETETTIAMMFYSALVGSLVFGATLPWSGHGVTLTLPDAALLTSLGILVTVGHFLVTAAYREAPASLLAPINYLHLVWGGGLGWLVFGHIPSGASLFGMALILVAGAAIALRSRRTGS